MSPITPELVDKIQKALEQLRIDLSIPDDIGILIYDKNIIDMSHVQEIILQAQSIRSDQRFVLHLDTVRS